MRPNSCCLAEYCSPALPDYAINDNLTPFIVMQNHYSLIYREEEREMFPTLKVCRAAFTDVMSY